MHGTSSCTLTFVLAYEHVAVRPGAEGGRHARQGQEGQGEARRQGGHNQEARRGQRGHRPGPARHRRPQAHRPVAWPGGRQPGEPQACRADLPSSTLCRKGSSWCSSQCFCSPNLQGESGFDQRKRLDIAAGYSRRASGQPGQWVHGLLSGAEVWGCCRTTSGRPR